MIRILKTSASVSDASLVLIFDAVGRRRDDLRLPGRWKRGAAVVRRLEGLVGPATIVAVVLAPVDILML